MTTLRTMVVSLGFAALFLAGCGNEVVKKVEEFADRACACKDTQCAEKVQADFMKFIADNADKKGSESDKNKVEKAAERLMKCIMDAQSKGAEAAPAEGAAPAAPAEGAAPAPAEGAAAPAAPAEGAAAPATPPAPAEGAAPAAAPN
jgi:hypothetical protein